MSETGCRTKSDDEFLAMAMKGNWHAVDLARMLLNIARVWDDLVDKDKPVSNEQVNRVMTDALIRIPGNPFYRDVGHLLRPIMEMGIINWHLSNELCKQRGIAREIAHVARYSAGDVMIYMMALIGGHEWAIEHGAEMKLRMQRNDFASFDAEMEALHESQP